MQGEPAGLVMLLNGVRGDSGGAHAAAMIALPAPRGQNVAPLYEFLTRVVYCRGLERGPVSTASFNVSRNP